MENVYNNVRHSSRIARAHAVFNESLNESQMKVELLQTSEDNIDVNIGGWGWIQGVQAPSHCLYFCLNKIFRIMCPWFV